MQAGAIADIAGVVENCDKALNKAEQEAGVSVRQAIIGIAGELVKGTTTTVRVSRKDSAKQLDIQEMEKIVGWCKDRAEVRARQKLPGSWAAKKCRCGLLTARWLTENRWLPCNDPIGFQGKDVVVQPVHRRFCPPDSHWCAEKPPQSWT